MVRERLHLTHLLALAIVVTLALLRRTVQRTVVTGDSMRPALRPGDRLVAVRIRGRFRIGDVVVLRDPRRLERLMVKRVAALGPAGVDVRGDDPGASTDSRHFGPVPAEAVVGRVVYRYAPPSRVGRIQSRR